MSALFAQSIASTISSPSSYSGLFWSCLQPAWSLGFTRWECWHLESWVLHDRFSHLSSCRKARLEAGISSAAQRHGQGLLAKEGAYDKITQEKLLHMVLLILESDSTGQTSSYPPSVRWPEGKFSPRDLVCIFSTCWAFSMFLLGSLSLFMTKILQSCYRFWFPEEKHPCLQSRKERGRQEVWQNQEGPIKVKKEKSGLWWLSQ